MADPAYIVAFKKLLKEGPDHSHVNEMVREFYGENDRAAIILLSTFAEQGIVWAIRSKMRKHSLVGQLFDPDGAIGTFGAKIFVAFALDLFGTKTKHDLDLIRTLRNGCAHSDIPLRFKTPEVRAVCDHLLLPVRRTLWWRARRRKYR